MFDICQRNRDISLSMTIFLVMAYYRTIWMFQKRASQVENHIPSILRFLCLRIKIQRGMLHVYSTYIGYQM